MPDTVCLQATTPWMHNQETTRRWTACSDWWLSWRTLCITVLALLVHMYRHGANWYPAAFLSFLRTSSQHPLAQCRVRMLSSFELPADVNARLPAVGLVFFRTIKASNRSVPPPRTYLRLQRRVLSRFLHFSGTFRHGSAW